MSKRSARTLIALLATVGALAAGCGDDGDGSSAAPLDGSSNDGCLTADQVQAEVDRIAGGIEGSQQEVEAKQEAIRQVEARAC